MLFRSVIGLPLGLFLGFARKMGILGIWIGLATGLTLVAAALTWKWKKMVALSASGQEPAS